MARRIEIHFSQQHEVLTVAEAGWAGKKNGELLGLAEKDFEVFVTTDKGIPHQQNISILDLPVCYEITEIILHKHLSFPSFARSCGLPKRLYSPYIR